jgi:hypothetical protein
MRLLIILFLLGVTIFGCDNRNTSDKFQELSEKLQPEKQSFEIDPTQDNLITCKNGSLVFFSSNLFIRQDGSEPQGNILIEIQEYTSYKDFISKNLSTTSDSLLLGSGGMIELTATNSGQECYVKNGMAYTIFFPRGEAEDQPMKLFYGVCNDDSIINWSLTPEKIYDEEKKGLTDFDNDSDSLLSITPDWVENYGMIMNYDDRDANIYSDVYPALYEFIENNFVPTSEIIKYYSENPSEYFRVAIHIDANAKITEVETLSDSSKFNAYFQTFFDTISSAFGKTPPQQEIIALLYFTAQNKFKNSDYAYSFNEKYSEFRDKALQKVNNAELNYYVLNSISLGLINCDYFYRTDSEKIDFVVTTENKESTKVYLIFENIRSMMVETNPNGNNFVFENVPANMNAKVVSINYTESQPMMCVEKIQLTKSGIKLDHFKSFTLDELDRELMSL